jgi:hypothetical protein
MYFLSNIAQVIKSRRVRWAGHVACIWATRLYKIFVVKPDRMRPFGRKGIGWRIRILGN